MSPIEEISNIRWLPRLGKIRMGIKKEGQKGPYPQAVDYFVCPDEVGAFYGDHPTELDIMFPSNSLELIAPQWYKCYSYTQGLICKGDGKTCRRKVDTSTGDFANKDTQNWETKEGICEPEHCPKIGGKQCRKMMSLLFLLPEVPGLGVYQLDTSSFYSIVNINSQLAEDGFIRQFTRGKIAFIPLKLSIGPQEVNPPGAGRKTVHILKLRADVKLAAIIRISRQAPSQVLLPTLEEEEPPDDLYPQEIMEIGEAASNSQGMICPIDGCEKIMTRYEDGMWRCPVHGAFPEHDISPTTTTITTFNKEEEVKQQKVTGEFSEQVTQPTPVPDETITSYRIDYEWLTSSLKQLKWSESTAKSWIGSTFGVGIDGDLATVLSRLSKDQADEFCKEIDNRVSQSRPQLF